MINNGPRVYQDMTWEEISASAGADMPIVIPIGATEQHGRHLPVCTDWVLPQRVLSEASRVRDLVVGPFVPFGYRSRPGSGGGQHFPGTVSLRATTFMSVLEDVLSELKRGGFRNIMLYNWHFENSNFVYEPAFLVSEQNPELKIVIVEDVFPEFTPERRRDRDVTVDALRRICGADRADGARRAAARGQPRRGTDRHADVDGQRFTVLTDGRERRDRQDAHPVAGGTGRRHRRRRVRAAHLNAGRPAGLSRVAPARTPQSSRCRRSACG